MNCIVFHNHNHIHHLPVFTIYFLYTVLNKNNNRHHNDVYTIGLKPVKCRIFSVNLGIVWMTHLALPLKFHKKLVKKAVLKYLRVIARIHAIIQKYMCISLPCWAFLNHSVTTFPYRLKKKRFSICKSWQ